MRAAKLVDILGGSTVDDAAILSALTLSPALPAALIQDVTAAYKKYKNSRASTFIVPLEMQDSWAAKFSNLYESPAKKHGLAWINDIATTTIYGYCPMCGNETHKSVDHYLPRSPWAEFSFLSLNLVPSCSTCNTKRGNRACSPRSTPRIFHPYFDHELLIQKLHVTKINGIKGDFRGPSFEPIAHPKLTSATKKQVTNHIKHSFDLTEYVQFCTNRWSELRPQLKKQSTVVSLRADIRLLASDAVRTGGPNSWRTAFFSGLAMSYQATQWLFDNRKKH